MIVKVTAGKTGINGFYLSEFSKKRVGDCSTERRKKDNAGQNSDDCRLCYMSAPLYALQLWFNYLIYRDNSEAGDAAVLAGLLQKPERIKPC